MDKEYLRPINTSSVVQQIVDRIKQAIINKELEPGDQLPGEKDLAVILGVSRNSIREAIKYLMAIGVLEVRRTEGTFVTNGFSNCMIDSIIYGIILSQNDSNFDTLKEMRKWIEFSILNLTALKISKEERVLLLEKFNILKDNVKNIKDVDSIIESDDNLYFTAFQFSRNPLLVDIAKTTRHFTLEARKQGFKRIIKMKKVDNFIRNREELLKMLNKKKILNLRELMMSDPLYD